MRFRKPWDPKRFYALFLVPLTLLTTIVPVSQAGTNAGHPSFSALSERLQSTTARFNKVLFTRSAKKTVEPLRAASARLKLADASNTAEALGAGSLAAAKPALPVEPLPGDIQRIRIDANGAFTAEWEGGRKEVFSAARVPAVGYWKNRYFLVEGEKTLAVSSSPIKFIPMGSTVLNLPDFSDPNWNKTVNLNWFRGNIEMVYSGKSNRLWAVNELKMEDYLRGIAEAGHDSPDEHLKVMAILSRSYAYHHVSNGGRHAGEPFHLKNSRNGNGDDQVYRGYLAEARQPRIAQAAAETAGSVVTYQGKPVITPYSTRADGRTRSPAEAGWNVDWPWVVSVADPDTAGMTRLGHGVGLSGHGSRKRAERGDSAATILGYYFPGTNVGQVDTASQTVRVAVFSRP